MFSATKFLYGGMTTTQRINFLNVRSNLEKIRKHCPDFPCELSKREGCNSYCGKYREIMEMSDDSDS